MRYGWRACSGLAAALLLVAATGMADPKPEPGSDSAAPDALMGQLLIASAAMQDPRFYHTVILLLRHDKEGAFGVIINRPIEERSIASLLAAGRNKAGPGETDQDNDAGIEGTIKIFGMIRLWT